MWVIEQSQLLEAPQQLINFQPRQLFGFGIVLYLLAAAVYYLIITFETSREAERRTLQARLHANEAELRALRAQIDPHFLFNSLNSISALIAQKPESAREMCITLSDFFRKSVQYGEKDVITLEEELSLTKHFLSIEQIRFGKRLSFAHNVDETALPCLLPPLILQPLIENCINHGIKHLLDGGTINVRVSRTPKTLKISVENPFDPEMPASRGSGIGLENVKRRLRTLYGNDVSIDVNKNENLFRVELILPGIEKKVT
jgi:LytS/YehU family sensor histidine kinase